MGWIFKSILGSSIHQINGSIDGKIKVSNRLAIFKGEGKQKSTSETLALSKIRWSIWYKCVTIGYSIRECDSKTMKIVTECDNNNKNKTC